MPQTEYIPAPTQGPNKANRPTAHDEGPAKQKQGTSKPTDKTKTNLNLHTLPQTTSHTFLFSYDARCHTQISHSTHLVHIQQICKYITTATKIQQTNHEASRLTTRTPALPTGKQTPHRQESEHAHNAAPPNPYRIVCPQSSAQSPNPRSTFPLACLRATAAADRVPRLPFVRFTAPAPAATFKAPKASSS